MKSIKLKFVDMWKSFDPSKSVLYQAFLNSGYEIRLCEDPDYLVYSVFGRENLQPRYDRCVKIAKNVEVVCPDFTLCDYGIGYEYLQFGDRYIQYPSFFLESKGVDRSNIRNTLEKGVDLQGDLKMKTGFCSFVYSNSSTADPFREQLFDTISTYKRVDSGGKFRNNIGLPNGVKDKLAFQRRYKFSIACENTAHPGNLTEKILESFAAHTVPIYWGDPRVKETFNEKAFICVHDYPSMEALLERIREVDENDDLYARMLSEPAFLDPEGNSCEAWQARMDAFIKHILDQPLEEAYRRPRYAHGKTYLEQMRHAFYPTPVRDAGKAVLQVLKAPVPVTLKRRLRNYLASKK